MERIKADIPQYLEIEAERTRFSRAIAFNMRIAAAILLMITSVVATVYLVSPKPETLSTPSTAVFAPTDRSLPRTAAAPTQEVRLEIAQEPEIPSVSPATPPPAAAPLRAREERANEADPETIGELTFAEKSVAGGVVGRTAAGVTEPRQVAENDRQNTLGDRQVALGDRQNTLGDRQVALGDRQNTLGDRQVALGDRQDAASTRPVTSSTRRAEDFAAEPAPPAAAAPQSRAARDSAARMESTISVTGNAPALSIMREARAAKVSLAPKDKVFGISIDPAAFQRIRTTLESGEQPAASSVDVEALVNYFAAAAEQRPRRGVALEVEASPAAIEADGDHAVLRFTVDAATMEEIPGGSIPPVAADARMEVSFNDRVVAHATRIGNGSPLAGEAVLLSGTSVTGIYALEMRPHLESGQTVATVRLHYRAVPSGRNQTITKTIVAKDLVSGWARATRRHRLATLGAVWGESLKGTTGGADVARRAEELATQTDDPLARALAAAASASADGGL
jgi:hypothetical protein